MGIIAAVALLGTVLSFIVAKWIAKPITRLTQVAERISKGDLEPSGEYPISRDEIGDLGRSLERMRASLKAAMLVGGLGLKLTVVLTASSLLLFASNTAIIGSYHAREQRRNFELFRLSNDGQWIGFSKKPTFTRGGRHLL